MSLINLEKNVENLFKELAEIVGKNFVTTDKKECEFFSTDIFYFSNDPAKIVVSPGSAAEVCEVLKTASIFEYDAIPRGGGMSYTGGYKPVNSNSIILNMQRLNSILEINEEDMYVTVECGVTWKDLYETLKKKGLRTPYFGPFSGMHATVGGALSQNSIFYGSSIHGTAADAVLALEIALPNGKIVKTGSSSNIQNPTPFFRYYGPDLSGLFLGDTGAMGFKTTATLRLIKFPSVQKFASFDFSTDEQMFSTMAEIARHQLAQECYGFDPFLMGLRMKFEGLKKDISALKSVVKSQKTIISGVKEAVKVAVAGRKFMEGVGYAMHVTIEGRDEADANSALKQVRNIAMLNNGKEIENSLPKLVRSNPFLPVNRLLGPNGERWVPIHVILPHSKVTKMLKELDNYFVLNADLVEENNIEWGYLASTISTTATLIEPTFFWPDSHYEIHKRYIEKDHYSKLKSFPQNLNARSAMEKIRNDLAKIFAESGGIHLQIGKVYKYKENKELNTLELLESIKNTLDPHNSINPGSLGIGIKSK